MSKILFMQKFWSCSMILMVSSHIYVLILITCPCITYMYVCIYIYTLFALRQKSVEYRVFGRFLKFLKLLRQLSPDMSGLWPRQSRICPAPGPRHIRVSGFSLYKGDPIPLGTLASFFHPISSVCDGWALPR
jgi:hypothetical protein